MKLLLFSLFCGILFGAGLALSHMINPNKVQDFLDITGNWDPSLAMVMIGALSVSLPAFQIVLKRASPISDASFHLPIQKSVDRRLIVGATIFGIGWGLTGYCPGPALAGLGLMSFEALVMAFGIGLGFVLYRSLFDRR